jgi:transposase
MVGVEAALEIRVLHRHGKSIREIAREMGVSRNTVRRYLRNSDVDGLSRCRIDVGNCNVV